MGVRAVAEVGRMLRPGTGRNTDAGATGDGYDRGPAVIRVRPGTGRNTDTAGDGRATREDVRFRPWGEGRSRLP